MTDLAPLSREERLRRVVILSCEFARNLAYHRSGRKCQAKWKGQPFWMTVSNNFLDQCVLVWCKLFADENGKHGWKKIVTNKNDFELIILEDLQLKACSFERLLQDMRRYRDRFLAHLDSDKVMQIPDLELPWKAVQSYHKYILTIERTTENFSDLPNDILDYYSFCEDEACRAYTRL